MKPSWIGLAAWFALAACDGETLYSTDDETEDQAPANNRAPIANLSVSQQILMAPVVAQINLMCSDADGDRLTYLIAFGATADYEISQSQAVQVSRSFSSSTEIRGACRDEHGAMSAVARRDVAVINATLQRDTILNLSNAARSQTGAAALMLNSQLTQVAQAHAKDMAERRYFSHTTPEGITFIQRLQRAGITNSYAGENIAGNSSAAGAIQAWLNSSGHRANMLNGAFRHLGVGVYRTPTSPYTYYVQVFTN
ncbi:MAG: CAP domain-containing protein [Longimicrobiales bacterium]